MRGRVTAIGALTLLFAPVPVALAAEATMAPEAGSVCPVLSCAVAPDQQQKRPRTRRGVLGWLYRYTRNIDIERSGGAPQPLILRSPLLAAAPDRSDCAEVMVAVPDPQACAVIAVNPGSEDSRTVTVPLPQYDAVSAQLLEAEIRDRLTSGAMVVLRTVDGVELRLDGGAVRFIIVTACGARVPRGIG